MPIGGGYFTLQNKVLPGAYINFVSTGGGVTAGDRGVAALPLELHFGEAGKLFRLDSATFYQQAQKLFGYDATAPELLLIRECLKHAKELLWYRVNTGGEKASATAGGVTVTAKYAGTRGNALAVAVAKNAEDESKFDVATFLDSKQVDLQTVADASGLADNDFVSFGSGTLTLAAAKTLSGGTDGTADAASYTAFLSALEVEEFNVVGYCGSDSAIKELFRTFAVRLIEQEGKKVTAVVAKMDANHEGVISVKNGVILSDGTEVPAEQAVAWVAGATAGAAINQSLTNQRYDGAVDVDDKYTKSQYEQAIKDGKFVFYAENGSARVLSDVNSLTDFTGGKTADWTSNRVVRVMNNWANDVARIFSSSYMGAQTNDNIGRDLFKADLIALATQYQNIRAISGFTPDDIVITQGEGKRDVVSTVCLRPCDAMEKLYMAVSVA